MMKLILSLTIAAAAILGLGLNAIAVVIVPADYPTIQQAIDASTDGTFIQVAPGTYHEAIDFRGKNITLTSQAGPELTVIDAGSSNLAVLISGPVTRSAGLGGFTIRNGRGGIAVGLGASPTIANNIITNNCACDGGGLYITFSSPLVVGNVITGNSRCVCSDGGGGGAGLYIGGSGSAEIIGNTITLNDTKNGYGGGICLNSAGTPTIKNNVILGNSANGDGGGIYMINSSDALIAGNLIAQNHAREGGGIYWLVPFGSRGPYLVNNTIADNYGNTGVYGAGFQDNALILNNIIMGKPNQTALLIGGTPIILTNIIESFFNGATSAIGTNGNVSADPGFLDPEWGDYHLRRVSPAIDAASITALATGDMDGIARSFDGNQDGRGSPDLGAYEYRPRPPAAPRRLTFDSTESSISLAWRASPEAISYRLGRGTTLAGPHPLIATTVETNFTDTNVVNHGYYYYVIRAVNDLGEGTNSALLRGIAGNYSPEAVPDFFTTAEDTLQVVDPVLNDTDLDQETLSIENLTAPAHGTIVRDGNSLTYRPAGNFHGLDTFTYVIADGRGGSSTGVVTVTVQPVNDPPVAFNRSMNLTNGLPVSIALSATDPDQDPLRFDLGNTPQHGIISGFGSTNAVFTYTPAHRYFGSDSFTFSASDGQITNVATVSLTIRAPIDSDGDGIPDYWESRYDLSDAAGDADGDGSRNVAEYIANTDPTNANSRVSFESIELGATGRAFFRWHAIGGVRYRVQVGLGDSRGGFNNVFFDLVRPAAQEIAPGPLGESTVMAFDDAVLPRTATGARYFRILVVP